MIHFRCNLQRCNLQELFILILLFPCGRRGQLFLVQVPILVYRVSSHNESTFVVMPSYNIILKIDLEGITSTGGYGGSNLGLTRWMDIDSIHVVKTWGHRVLRLSLKGELSFPFPGGHPPSIMLVWQLVQVRVDCCSLQPALLSPAFTIYFFHHYFS